MRKNRIEAISKVVFVGRGFNRDVQSPKNQGCSP